MITLKHDRILLIIIILKSHNTIVNDSKQTNKQTKSNMTNPENSGFLDDSIHRVTKTAIKQNSHQSNFFSGRMYQSIALKCQGCHEHNPDKESCMHFLLAMTCHYHLVTNALNAQWTSFNVCTFSTVNIYSCIRINMLIFIFAYCMCFCLPETFESLEIAALLLYDTYKLSIYSTKMKQ